MRNELKVGLAVLASALILYFGIRFLQDRSFFGGDYRVIALFDDAQGLTPGAFVRLNGVSVGTVAGVSLSPDAREVEIAMDIDGDIRIPRGTRVATSGLSALGEVNVELTPPAGAAAGRPLGAGDTLRAIQTPDLFDLLAGESTAITARADSALIRALSVFTTIDQTLANSSGDLTAVLAQLRFLTTAATKTLQDERGRIEGTLGSVAQAAARTEELAANLAAVGEATAGDVSADLRATAQTIRGVTAANADSISAAVAQANRTLRNVDASLSSLSALTVQLDSTLAIATSDQSTLGLLLQDPSLYHNANAAAASLQQLLQDVQRDPGRYVQDLDLIRVF